MTESTSFPKLCEQAELLLAEGKQLYAECSEAYIKASPRAVEKPAEFRLQIQELFRGLVLRIIHGMVLADRKLTSRELAICKHLFSHLWERPFIDEQVKSVLIRHGEQDPFRWEDLLWPFERLSAFQQRVVELETLVMRLGQLLKRVDGTVKDAELHYLHWLKGELQRVLHPIRVDVSGDDDMPASTAPARHGKKTAIQTRVAQAKEELKPLPVPPELINLDELLAELEALIGLTGVKRDVTELTHFLQMQKQRQAHGLPVTSISLHAIFSGNPGTGKTTVARLYGKLLGALGLLKKGHLVETDRGGLVAEYAGQTAGKTAARFDEALDGVLFIDEAYSLVNDGEDPYGAEAVQTLLKRMEDQRDRVVVILAGYPEPMENLLCTNPGLASRFGRTLTFADYSPVELCRIFQTFCQRDHYELPGTTRAHLLDGFAWHYAQRNERFGNGRLARNLYEASLRRLASRLAKGKQVTKADLITLQHNDLVFDDLPGEVKSKLGTNRYEALCQGCAQQVPLEASQLGTVVKCPHCQRAHNMEWGTPVGHAVRASTG